MMDNPPFDPGQSCMSWSALRMSHRHLTMTRRHARSVMIIPAAGSTLPTRRMASGMKHCQPASDAARTN
jgi:hypothetical protein